MEGPDSSTKAVIQEGAPFWTKAQLSVEGRTVHPRDNQQPLEEDANSRPIKFF